MKSNTKMICVGVMAAIGLMFAKSNEPVVYGVDSQPVVVESLADKRNEAEKELQRYTVAVGRAMVDCEEGGKGYKSCDDADYLRSQQQDKSAAFVKADNELNNK